MSLAMKKVYDNYASFYDILFGKIFQQGRTLTTDIVNSSAKPDARVLEIGVGTGISLPLYRKDLHISGIDISDKMLAKAKNRVIKNKLGNRISLEIMDATNLSYENERFDFIVAMYVASVVPNVYQFLNEISRVCKENGHIILVNHFASTNQTMRAIENKFAKAYSFIGFKSDLQIQDVLNHTKLQLVNQKKTNMFQYWQMLHFIKTEAC